MFSMNDVIGLVQEFLEVKYVVLRVENVISSRV